MSECLKWVGTPRFKAGLLDELYDYLPHMGELLQEFCDRGAPCDNSLRELTNLVMDVPKQSELSGRFEVRFKESVYPGSPEPDYTEPVTATVRFVIDLETGDLALEAEHLPAATDAPAAN